MASKLRRVLITEVKTIEMTNWGLKFHVIKPFSAYTLTSTDFCEKIILTFTLKFPEKGLGTMAAIGPLLAFHKVLSIYAVCSTNSKSNDNADLLLD
jgi:hypothetical protein